MSDKPAVPADVAALIARLRKRARDDEKYMADGETYLDSPDWHTAAALQSQQERIYELEGEWAALSQDDGKLERALERAEARVAELETYRIACAALTDRVAELERGTLPENALRIDAAIATRKP